jgi:hypothetical protein
MRTRIRRTLIAGSAVGALMLGAGFGSSAVLAGEEIRVGGIVVDDPLSVTSQPLCPPRPILPTGIFCDPRAALEVVSLGDPLGGSIFVERLDAGLPDVDGGPVAVSGDTLDGPLTVAGQVLCPPRPINPPNVIFCDR